MVSKWLAKDSMCLSCVREMASCELGVGSSIVMEQAMVNKKKNIGKERMR